jgi:diadenosine tetraphosphate (Ap4A) HIT family hydrolase
VSVQAACDLCAHIGGELLWRDDKCRVVLVADDDYPGFCRVVWDAHVKEMTDLPAADQQHCMRVVLAVERAVRDKVKPHKINLASLGNMTPHLHWHVIPRHSGDAHFPESVWSARQRTTSPASGEKMRLVREKLTKALADLL